MKLDKWDCRLIALFKSNKPDVLEKAKEVWAERCGIDLEYVELATINVHLLKLAHRLNLFDREHEFVQFIMNLAPKKNYWFTTTPGYLTQQETDPQIILFSRLDSLFCLTKTSKLPGYSEWATGEKVLTP